MTPIAERAAPSEAAVLPPYRSRPGLKGAFGPGLLGTVALLLTALAYGALFVISAPYYLLQLALPLLVLGAFVIWALPDRRSAPTALLEGLFFAFVIGLLCWPDYLAVALPGLPWVTVIRLIAVPLVTILLICIAVSKMFRDEMKAILNSLPAMWKMLVMLIAVQAFSIALSRDPGVSVEKFILAQLNWTAIFFVSCYVFSKPHRAERWAFLIWMITLFVGIIGVFEWRQSQVLWAGHIPSFLAIEDESVLRILSGASRAASGIYRVQSKFTTSLGLAEFISLALPFVIYFITGNYKVWIRVAALITVPFLFFIIIITDSRLGVVGFFLSLLFSLFFIGATRWRRVRSSLFGPAIVLAYPAIFAAFIAATFFVGRLRAMVWGSGAQQYSTEARQVQYEMGIPMVLSNPFGYGMGQAADTLGYVNLAGALTIDTYFLAVALEYGLLGFILYYGMVLLGIYKAGWSAITETGPATEPLFVPLAISITNFFVIKSIFSQQENHPMIFMMLGMVVALVYRSSQAPINMAARD